MDSKWFSTKRREVLNDVDKWWPVYHFSCYGLNHHPTAVPGDFAPEELRAHAYLHQTDYARHTKLASALEQRHAKNKQLSIMPVRA